MTTPLRLDETLDDRRVAILLVCGSGGVGKTTTAAALALRAAERGRRVAVITVDPAKRLASALGVDELSDEPAAVAGVDETAGGHLDAMLLDMKRAFDALVTARTSPARARALLDNPFYRALSESFGGTQEYLAMDRLGSLYRDGVQRERRWDLVVVDTPPSVSALDFLDGPQRLGRLLDSRLFQLATAPARGGMRLLGGGMNLVQPLLTSLVGTRSLQDLQTFLTAADDVLLGLRQRGEATRAVLSSSATSCVVVTTPEADPLQEALALVARLRQERITTAGVVVNRARPDFGPAPAQPPGNELEAWLAQRADALHTTALEQSRLLEAAATRLAVRRISEHTAEIIDLDELRRLGALLAGADD